MKRLFLIIMVLFALAVSATADGVIIPRPRPWLPPQPKVNVKYHHVDVEINDPIALTKIDQVFVNPYHREIEADYLFPVPENAVISRFVAWLDGHKMEAELLDAKQARKIYEDIVRRRKDPALLEYAGRGIYRMRVYPIPANGEVRIKIEYEQTLKSDYGTVEYIYPLNTEKYSGANLDECKINVEVNSFEKIGTLFCPSHEIKSNRVTDKSFTVVYHKRNVKPNQDFKLYFTRQKRDFGFHLLSYKEPHSENGFFLGILSPPLENNHEKIDKNIIFLLDSSGSMRGDKFSQAIDALKFVLQGLNDNDDFNIIDYDDVVRPFKEKLVRADRDNIDEALQFAKNLEAAGGTNIYDALTSACSMIPNDDDPTYILFLTDGRPTVGNTNIDMIVKNTTNLNEKRARLFSFGVGYNVNAHLLDRLTGENSGIPEYVLPEEDIEVKVSRLASKISNPALTDISLTFESVKTESIYPDPLPDLFYGSEIIIAGRFNGQENSEAIITGKIGNKDVTYEFPIRFSEGGPKDEFIPLLWANRRIAYLLQQMRLHGTDDELVREVVELSKKYGIVTEYTSFLIEGDSRYEAEVYLRMAPSELHGALRENIEKKSQEQTGMAAFRQSKNIVVQAERPVIDKYAVSTVKRATMDRVTTQVGSRGFFQTNGNWIQGDIQEDKFDIEIKRYSDAYFQILEKDPSLGRYLGLGDQVRLMIGAQVVQISDAGQETLSEKELNLLFP